MEIGGDAWLQMSVDRDYDDDDISQLFCPDCGIHFFSFRTSIIIIVFLKHCHHEHGTQDLSLVCDRISDSSHLS
jgi:hypothetical protein